jgi:hypothetical protein
LCKYHGISAKIGSSIQDFVLQAPEIEPAVADP